MASDTVRRLLSMVTMRGGWAKPVSKTGYRRSGVAVRFRRDDFSDSLVAEADRSFFGELEMSIEWSRSQYSVVRAYRGMGAPEDVDLSRTLRVGLWVAPKGFGYERTGFGPAFTVHAGKPFSWGFAYLDGRATSLFTGSGLDSGTVAGGGAVALQLIPRHSVMVSASGGIAKDPHPGAEFDLGLTFGPRGYPLHAFTGDRAYFLTTEYKWVALPDVFGLFAVGLAAFGDYGGAWYDGSPRRTGTDAGIGLWIGSTRSSATKGATRIDVSRRKANDALGAAWVLSNRVPASRSTGRPPDGAARAPRRVARGPRGYRGHVRGRMVSPPVARDSAMDRKQAQGNEMRSRSQSPGASNRGRGNDENEADFSNGAWRRGRPDWRHDGRRGSDCRNIERRPDRSVCDGQAQV